MSNINNKEPDCLRIEKYSDCRFFTGNFIENTYRIKSSKSNFNYQEF